MFLVEQAWWFYEVWKSGASLLAPAAPDGTGAFAVYMGASGNQPGMWRMVMTLDLLKY